MFRPSVSAGDDSLAIKEEPLTTVNPMKMNLSVLFAHACAKKYFDQHSSVPYHKRRFIFVHLWFYWWSRNILVPLPSVYEFSDIFITCSWEDNNDPSSYSILWWTSWIICYLQPWRFTCWPVWCWWWCVDMPFHFYHRLTLPQTALVSWLCWTSIIHLLNNWASHKSSFTCYQADVTSNDYYSASDMTLIHGVGRYVDFMSETGKWVLIWCIRWSEDPSHDLVIVNIVQGTQ